MSLRDYHVDVQPLDGALGGGFVVLVPALKGCIADGDTREEALRNAYDAIVCWLDAARALGRPVPRP